MPRLSRRWLAGGLLVGLGWLASPTPVPVYDGLPNSDEPYRYVSPPAGVAKTAPPTSVASDTPVASGGNAQGFSLQTGEVGPQVSVFVPQYALRAARGPIHVTIAPSAPTDVPAGLRADGNTYTFAFTAPGGPVTLDPAHAAIATLYLRSTSRATPQPTLYFRTAEGSTWQALQTTAGGFDIRVAAFKGAGQYLLLRPDSAGSTSSSSPLQSLAVVGGAVVLSVLAVVLVVRLRSPAE